ncbi:MAG: hypothetical protein ABEI77_03995 [Halorientalis sp.]
MDVIGDLVTRERRRKEPLVYASGSQPYTAHKFCTDAWKTASLFRYHGLGPQRELVVGDDPEPQALLGIVGAGLLGARVRIGQPTPEARLVVGPSDAFGDWEPTPGTKRVVYGALPEDPDVIHFERDTWSENPTMPPDRVDPDADLLVTDEETYTHADLLAATERIVDDVGLTSDDEVAVRGPLSDPGVLVAGVLAPMLVDGTIALEGSDRTGTVSVGGEDAPEPTIVDPASARP